MPEANPKMNLPIAKVAVKGMTTTQEPTTVIQSANIIDFLLPNLFKCPDIKDPKNPPTKLMAVISGISKDDDEPQERVAETLG
jgi:hypothetical protein